MSKKTTTENQYVVQRLVITITESLSIRENYNIFFFTQQFLFATQFDYKNQWFFS